MILLDTSVLSAVLRRRRPGDAEPRLAERLSALLDGEETVGIPGIVLQEILTGVKEAAQFQALRRAVVRGFPVVAAKAADHILAADIANKCRNKGIAVSAGDALIAAVAIQARARLFTSDADFALIAKHTALRLLAS